MAPSASIRAWAQRLLAVEAANRSVSVARVHEALLVCEKFRICLTRLAGADGFAALLRRALALARGDVPSLQAVKVTVDCRLEGLEDFFAAGAGNAGTEAASAIIAHLLGLLVTFIGEPLTLRLVREAWPDTSLGD